MFGGPVITTISKGVLGGRIEDMDETTVDSVVCINILVQRGVKCT